MSGLAVAGGALGLAGCGSSTAGDQSALRFTWWGNDVRNRLTQQALDLFQQQNPKIKITGVPGTWGGYWDKLATAVAGNNSPDVMQQADNYLVEYAGRGVLADLTKFKGLDLSQFDPAVLASSTIDGKVYGVPTGVTALSCWVNQTVLEQVGEPMPDDATWTWESYAALCERITRNSGGKVFGSGQFGMDENLFTLFLRQHGMNLFNGKEIGFTREVVIEFWEYCLRLQASGAAMGIKQSVEAQGGSIEQSAIVTGKIAFSTGWASQITQAQAGGKANLKLLQIPGESTSKARGIFVKPSQHFAVAAKSKHQEAAVALVNFLVNTTQAGEILLTDRGIPGNAKVLAAVQPKFSDGDKKAADYISLLKKYQLTALAATPTGVSQLGTIINRCAQTALYKQQPVDKAADQFMAELKAAVK